jgi:hypothetical protein
MIYHFIPFQSDEIKAIMGEELVQWFAAYLVEYRIQFEFNLHSLYLDLLDQIGNEQLNVLIMETTTKNIRVSIAVYHGRTGKKTA